MSGLGIPVDPEVCLILSGELREFIGVEEVSHGNKRFRKSLFIISLKWKGGVLLIEQVLDARDFQYIELARIRQRHGIWWARAWR